MVAVRGDVLLLGGSGLGLLVVSGLHLLLLDFLLLLSSILLDLGCLGGGLLGSSLSRAGWLLVLLGGIV